MKPQDPPKIEKEARKNSASHDARKTPTDVSVRAPHDQYEAIAVVVRGFCYS